jgi:hypothetical protein
VPFSRSVRYVVLDFLRDLIAVQRLPGMGQKKRKVSETMPAESSLGNLRSEEDATAEPAGRSAAPPTSCPLPHSPSLIDLLHPSTSLYNIMRFIVLLLSNSQALCAPSRSWRRKCINPPPGRWGVDGLRGVCWGALRQSPRARRSSGARSSNLPSMKSIIHDAGPAAPPTLQQRVSRTLSSWTVTRVTFP